MASSPASVLITGASSGLGHAAALLMARKGWQVFGSVRKPADGERLQSASEGRVTPVFFDLNDGPAIAAAAEVVRQKVGTAGLNALVNNAALMVQGPLEYVPLDDVRRQFEINVFGQLAVTQAFLPLIRQARQANGKARILFIGSLIAKMAVAFFGPLCASKFALEALADSLRLELHKFGIDVIKVHPGTIATPAVDKARQDAETMLAALPPAGQEQYGDTIRQWVEVFAKEAATGTTPDKVAEVIHTALSAEHPKGMYMGDWSTAALESFVSLAPQGLLDWMRRRMQHLD
jgi:NAD(P)-dependent dehydrogenase (short-subunit alcohol dehydrogenase family)